MNCNEFETEIRHFIDGSIDPSQLRGFVEHLHGCPECYDELGIYFIVNTALAKVDRDEAQSYDFQGQMDILINDYEKQIHHLDMKHKTVCAITNTANIVVLAALAIAFLRWFNILQ
ncbi:anti-sigma factor family protein [Parasporobacterium paucivorans]|uniref:Zinc-finger n=1 Tax=Parasporobacterium paucivorans DSM 15970 TaxID=1122934 RepID=A0A1M6A6S9_9FIRM|nr:zf-HC2 domain-containing protein [Parasporobacterium paucivorans]SHI32192.1 hypothetical protein SAMN02745691_00083 [Parasporobacterium paucivorans DSM 15970]